MYEDNTVFVIGAGASQEFGMPVGWQLLKEIRDNSLFHFDHGPYPSSGNRKIFDEVQNRHGDNHDEMVEIFGAFGDIHRSIETAGSIDEYINRYGDDPVISEVGKLQIAFSILKAEGKSNLVPRPGREADGVDWDRTENTWIAPFSRALFDGVRAPEVESIGQNITIICFNYDRCIEHYLEYAIQRAYRGVDRKTARAIVKNINIIHPYGMIGGINQMSFGHPLENANLYDISKNLITWSESVEDQGMVAEIKNAVEQSRNLVFLGFAFANQNMEILSSESPEHRQLRDVYATGYGLSRDIEYKLKKKITHLYSSNSENGSYHQRINIHYEAKCYDLIRSQLMNFMV